MTIKSNNSADWGILAQSAQNGDKRAYHKLLSEIAPYIRNTLLKNLSSSDAVEDIVQEVLISVHKSLKTYSADRPFKPWLHAIMNFRRTDYLRKYYAERANKSAPLEHAEFSQEGVTKPTHAGELKDIEGALSTFSEQQRRIFTMVKIEGHTIEHVAKVLNLKESAVKVAAHRTMKKLQGILK